MIINHDRIEAIVLAGGFGTRLQSIIANVPKPMAPMDNKGTPFLKILFDYMQNNQVTDVILSTGYKSEKIEEYFGRQYKNMKLEYSIEDQPLLTGGAIKKALERCSMDNVFVLNGDTYFDVDLKDMLHNHCQKHADISVAIKQMYDFDRYGKVLIGNDRIVSFQEKQFCHDGWINGGIYCMTYDILASISKIKFSLEKDFLETNASKMRIIPYKSNGLFVDIGIPADYFKARKILGR